MPKVGTRPELLDGEWVGVCRGVPSLRFDELQSDTTWFTRIDAGEEDARWVVPEDEQPCLEFGPVHINDVQDPNWTSGVLTIRDVSNVDVRNILPVEGRLTDEDVRRERDWLFSSLEQEDED
jgi:hypothetical protein